MVVLAAGAAAAAAMVVVDLLPLWRSGAVADAGAGAVSSEID